MMCFGNKSNPKVDNGIDNLDQSHIRLSVQQRPNKPVKSSGGFMTNTPVGRSKKILREMPASQRKGARSE
jgi:hypothetical protein